MTKINNMLKVKIKNLAVSCAIALSSFAPAYAADDLISVYKNAEQNDPTFLASKSSLQASNLNIDLAKTFWFPTVSGSYGTSTSRTYYREALTEDENGNPLLDEEGNPISIKKTAWSDGSTWGISLSQSIYDHSNWLGLDKAEMGVKAAEAQHSSVQQQLFIRVAQAYFNVLAANDGLEFSKAEKEAIERQLEQTNQRYRVGLIAVTAVHEAKANYDRAKANEILAQNTLDNSLENLREITGNYHTDLLSLKDDLPLETPEPQDIDQWVQVAENNNLAILAQKLNLDIAMKDIDIKNASHLPSVGLSAGLDGNPVAERFGFGDDSYNTSLSLSVSIPIFSGFSTSTQVTQAKYRYQEAAHNMEAQRRKAVRETRSAYLGVLAQISSIQALKQAEVSAQSALDATQAGLEAGTRTIVDVLQSTTTLFSSKRNLAQAKYDYVLNLLKLKQAAGILKEDDIRQVNQWLK